jgi:glucose-6-phosphate isomerase
MKKTTLVDRIMAALKGGDDQKIAKFATAVEKTLNGQKSNLTDKIADLEEQLADAVEYLNEVTVTINVDRISTTENRKDYILDYMNTIGTAMRSVELIEAEIADFKTQLERVEKAEKLIFNN